jgi:hypothetical protein
MNEKPPLVKWIVTYRTLLIAAIMTAAGMALLGWTSDVQRWSNATSWQALLQQVGSLLLVTGLLTLVWDLFSKRAFARELLDLTGLASDVRAAGISRIVSSFRGELEWRYLLDGARTLDLFVCWAKTWRNQHEEQLAAVLSRRDGLIRVILPDYEDASTVSAMETHFADYDAERIRGEIVEAVSFFKTLHKRRSNASATVEIYLVKRVPLFSWYRIDDNIAMLAFYAHRYKVSNVPTIVVKRGGHLFEFASEELAFLASTANGARKIGVEED